MTTTPQPRTPSVPCGDWHGHASHEYEHPEHGPVTCSGLAFDHPPDPDAGATLRIDVLARPDARFPGFVVYEVRVLRPADLTTAEAARALRGAADALDGA